MTGAWSKGRGVRWLLAAATVGVLALLACQKRSALTQNMSMHGVGEWQVGVANDPDPPHAGENTITVVARDSSGKPMHGSLDLVVSMPAMGAMPYMESRGSVKPGGSDTFRASYGLAMGGEWDVTVRLRPDDGPVAEAQYRLSTSIPGLAWVGGTPARGGQSPGSVPAMPGGDSSAGTILIDATRRQSLGIRIDTVRVRNLSTTLRVPGRIAFDEAHQAEVALKFNGWVRRLSANVTGQAIRRGQVLFTVYSPEIWSAQQEYLEALRAANSDQGKNALGSSSVELAQAARERLLLWDLSPGDIAAIARAGRPLEAVPIRSPVSGVITEKNVVQGSAFQAGQVLFRMAQLDPIWVIASVPQQNVSFVRPGMAAMVHDPYRGAVGRTGRVAFIYPALDSMTRTAEVRIEAPNPGGRLQPGTFVDVDLKTPLLERIAVPESAVLPTGERYVVFVDLGDGRLAPRDVQLGARAGGYYEVLSGLRAGEIVVTSGNFLVAAESKLRSATQKW
jgi:membrane fusion protein, copper/silver efflux system